MYKLNPTLYGLMITLLISLVSCTHKFNLDDVCFNFKLCTLSDAVAYEKFIGSQLIEDSVFYSYLPGGRKDNRVYSRKKSGCGLPLYVKYVTFNEENANHLWCIKYFWGPYQGMAYDSIYVQEEMFYYFKGNPYCTSRLYSEFSSLVYQINERIGERAITPSDKEYIEVDGEFSWLHYLPSMEHEKLMQFQIGQLPTTETDNYCLEQDYGTGRELSIKRYNTYANSINPYEGFREYDMNRNQHFIFLKGMPYAYISLKYIPGLGNKEFRFE